jgi:serine/threonine protein kinase
MTAARPDNEAIFHAARDIPDPDRRREYVRAACGGDQTRIAYFEALLAAADAPDSLLDRPPGGAPGATLDLPIPESPGAVIGPYKLLEQIGEGGMGTVWMAQQQEPVRRLVAVKLIKAGMDSRQVIARFEAERQALALMDHPNIAKVLDAGTSSSGRPYFVMDMVRGVSITRYCDEHHLTPQQRLELFVPVCQAVQHAHQKGVIHRDLKPSNVLVAPCDGKPVPKVIDFGVAKAAGQSLTDKTLVTGLGAIVGTLEYMSPEQAGLNQLDIDTRSDIYSLGVLLYELLTGSTPLDRRRLKTAGMLEALRLIREQEPARPSTKLSTAEGLPTLAASRGMEPTRLVKLLRGELDWIVMKALEKDRARRYETANGLAMDVQRYLADEPVLACPPSAGYRLGKFVRRNKTGLAVAGLVLVFLVLLGSVAGWALRDRKAREDDLVRETARKLALTEQGIRQSLDLAGKARAELHAELRQPGGLRELLEHPSRWELLLQKAQAELMQARTLMARAEGNLDVEVTQALAQLEEQLANDEADYRLLVTGHDSQSRDPRRAAELAGEAAELYPQDGARWRALGMAHYRTGSFRAAVEALEMSRVNAPHPHYEKDSGTLFFLSMACGRLNKNEAARTYFAQAVEWRMAIGHNEEELRHFCAEAAAVLGLEVPPTLKDPPASAPGPALLKPAAGATLNNSDLYGTALRVWEFDWADVPGATQYHLAVIMPAAMVPTIYSSTLTSSSYRFEAKGCIGDPYRRGWRWKVRALVRGVWTDWSEERTFDLAPVEVQFAPTVKAPSGLAPGPALLKPAAGATLDNSDLYGTKSRVWDFDWADVPGATQYHLAVIMPTAKRPTIDVSTLTSSSYRFEAKGCISDPYRRGWRWKVRAQVRGVWTNWSEERTFDLAPVDMTPAVPAQKSGR